MPAKEFDFERCKAETLLRNYKLNKYQFNRKSDLIRINAAKSKKYLSDADVIKELERQNQVLIQRNNELELELSELTDRKEIQNFRDHVKQTEDENYALKRRVQDLEKKVSNLNNQLSTDSDVKSLRNKIFQIGDDIKFIIKYHEDYQSLVYNLNKILDLKHKIKILDTKTIDNQILESLKVIRAIRKFNSINREIWDIVQVINKEYKSVESLADREYGRAFHHTYTYDTTYNDVYNLMISRVNYLTERLSKISDFCRNIMFATDIDFACQKQFYFIYGDNKRELNFRGALGFINSICEISKDSNHEVHHDFMIYRKSHKYSFDTSNN